MTGVQSKRNLQHFLKQDLKINPLLMAASTKRANPTLVICQEAEKKSQIITFTVKTNYQSTYFDT